MVNINTIPIGLRHVLRYEGKYNYEAEGHTSVSKAEYQDLVEEYADFDYSWYWDDYNHVWLSHFRNIMSNSIYVQ